MVVLRVTVVVEHRLGRAAQVAGGPLLAPSTLPPLVPLA